MEILKKDLCLVAHGKERIKDVFSECAENGFVFPFLPIFDEDVETLFLTSFFLSQSFGEHSSALIQGFEVELENGKIIKQGGRMKKTNTGYNLIPLFFGNKKRKLTGEQNPLAIVPEFQVKKVYFKLLTKGKVKVMKEKIKETTKGVAEKILHLLPQYDIALIRKREKEINFLRTEVPFLRHRTGQREQEENKEKSIILPDSYRDIYEFLPAGRLYSEENTGEREKLMEKVKLLDNIGEQREKLAESFGKELLEKKIGKFRSGNLVIIPVENFIFLVGT